MKYAIDRYGIGNEIEVNADDLIISIIFHNVAHVFTVLNVTK